MYIESVSLVVTEKCNLACTYCFEGEKQFCNMTVETGLAAVDWLFREDVSGPSPNLDISFFGGEPLLNLEVINAVVARGKDLAAQSSRRIHFSATSNGTLFCERVADFWKEQDIGILLSCDGVPEAHDAFRCFPSGRGSFASVAANMPHVVGAGRAKEVRMTVMPQTAGHLAEGVAWLKDQGFHSVAVFPVEETTWSEDALLTFQDQLYRAGELMVEAIEKGENFAVNPIDRAIKSLCGEKRSNQDSLCGAGRQFVAVGVEGNIYPCHRFATNREQSMREKYAIGNVWSGIDEKRRLFYIRMNRGALLGCDIACQDCSLAGRCAGGCMAANLAVTGHMALRPAHSRLHELAHHEVAKSIVAYFDQNPCEHFERRFCNQTSQAHVA